MGVYNCYGRECVQLKLGNCELKSFRVGDNVDIPDGVYVGYEGVVVILKGKLARVFNSIRDKWGGELDLHDILNSRNAVSIPNIIAVNSFYDNSESEEKPIVRKERKCKQHLKQIKL
ncbi:hypothetical protein A2Z67_04885 [Candidatus Woesebacteria bacterium RBG_13_36_22]|uniref:Uncharacterized protein n=1 Tax=Candidatus Woesebacteria bacterium RBG_13_36_22 TaxID=1802478 RepID=A0A1F7X2E4_9BACT|nr:MAG: hypothetical protein A2Z67_04885 [Candidatus Woesebacteria bacterium RBG_13_36_22]